MSHAGEKLNNKSVSIVAFMQTRGDVYEAMKRIMVGFVLWRADSGMRHADPEALAREADAFLRVPDPIGYADSDLPIPDVCGLCGAARPYRAGGAWWELHGATTYLCCNCSLAMDTMGLVDYAPTPQYEPGYHWDTGEARAQRFEAGL